MAKTTKAKRAVDILVTTLGSLADSSITTNSLQLLIVRIAALTARVCSERDGVR